MAFTQKTFSASPNCKSEYVAVIDPNRILKKASGANRI